MTPLADGSGVDWVRAAETLIAAVLGGAGALFVRVKGVRTQEETRITAELRKLTDKQNKRIERLEQKLDESDQKHREDIDDLREKHRQEVDAANEQERNCQMQLEQMRGWIRMCEYHLRAAKVEFTPFPDRPKGDP